MMVLADVVLSEPALGRSRRSTCFQAIYNKINTGHNFHKIVCSVVAHFLGNKFHTTSPGSHPCFDINFFNLLSGQIFFPLLVFKMSGPALCTLVLQLQQTSLAAQVHFCIRNRVLMVGFFFSFFWLSYGIRVLELKALMIGYVFDF